jgi:hypothetical protein
VQIGLELVELDAATETQVAKPIRFYTHLEGHHVGGRRRIGELRLELDGAEHLEVE